MPIDIRLATTADLDVYIAYMLQHFDESGTDGDVHYTTKDRGDPLDPEGLRARTIEHWSADLDGTGWRRTFAAFDGERMVGHAELVGAAERTARHRVELGMGVLRSHRRRGLGRALLAAAVDWGRGQPRIDWVDLGVFAPNEVAHAMYRAAGFEELGRTPDCYRVDDERLEEIAMTLSVGRP